MFDKLPVQHGKYSLSLHVINSLRSIKKNRSSFWVTLSNPTIPRTCTLMWLCMLHVWPKRKTHRMHMFTYYQYSFKCAAMCFAPFHIMFGYIWRSVSNAGWIDCSCEWTSNLPLATDSYLSLDWREASSYKARRLRHSDTKANSLKIHWNIF